MKHSFPALPSPLAASSWLSTGPAAPRPPARRPPGRDTRAARRALHVGRLRQLPARRPLAVGDVSAEPARARRSSRFTSTTGTAWAGRTASRRAAVHGAPVRVDARAAAPRSSTRRRSWCRDATSSRDGGSASPQIAAARAKPARATIALEAAHSTARPVSASTRERADQPARRNAAVWLAYTDSGARLGRQGRREPRRAACPRPCRARAVRPVRGRRRGEATRRHRDARRPSAAATRRSWPSCRTARPARCCRR